MSDVPDEQGTRFPVSLVLVDPVADAETMDGVVAVRVESVGMQPCKKLVHRQTGNQGILLDNGWPVLLHAPVVRPIQKSRASWFGDGTATMSDGVARDALPG